MAGQQRGTQGMHSLHLEIVGSQFCVVDVQDCLGIEPRGDTNLWKENKPSKSENVQWSSCFIQVYCTQQYSMGWIYIYI